jgi:hypothetical protein
MICGQNLSPQLTIYDYFNILTNQERGDINSSFINSTIINPPQVYQPAVKIMSYDLHRATTYKKLQV